MRINGLIAATFSTFNSEGKLDLGPIPELVEKLLADGLKGIFICGTNGEGPNMTSEERMAVAEAYIKAANKRLLVMVHVGHNSIEESGKLAKHAERIGADAISSVAGFYFKPTSVAILAACMAKIASAAPNTPFYYYHIPSLTGIHMNMIEFLQIAEQQIPNLAGIKYTASTLHEYQACLKYKNGKFDILFGYDELLLSALVVGATGAIGSTYSFAAPLYRQVMEHFRRGNLERAGNTQFKLVQMISVLQQFSSIPAQKAIMSFLGYELGPTRLPLKQLERDELDTLYKELESIGFFKLLKGQIVSQ